MGPRRKTEPGPVPAPHAPEPALKRAANTTDWLKVLVGAAVAMFAAGGIARAFVGNLATKEDVREAVSEHAVASHPVIIERLGQLELRQTRTARDVRWMRYILARMAERQGVAAPSPLDIDLDRDPDEPLQSAPPPQ
jgi:hypothetical protein